MARAAAVAPDGRIVIAANASTSARGDRPQVYTPAVLRLTADGRPDLTLAVRGAVLLSYPDQSFGQFSAVSVLPDGRIVAAGVVRQTSGTILGGAARLTAAGQLDPTYGSGGLALTQPVATGSGGITNGTPVVTAAVDAAGSAVFDTATYFVSSPTGTVVYRLTPAGAADTGFGSGGRVLFSTTPGSGTADPAFDLQAGLAFQPNGDILLGGTDHAGEINTTAGALTRLIGSDPPAGFVAAVPGTLTAGGPADGTSAALNPTGGTYAAAGTTTVFPGFAGAVRGTTADVNADGTPDYVYATGPGGGPRVAVF
ncbi:hypothetical protein J0H58_06855, partial [bacterium]|nr:hypothetical protein [bacterium]